MRTDTVQNRNRLTGSELKLIGCASMLIDHFAKCFDFTGTANLICCHLIGRLAFPIFAFLLVEGFLHTRHMKRYFLSLFLFAVLSELPYDLAINGSGRLFPEFTCQNTLFTLTLGLLMLNCIKKAEALYANRTSAYTLISVPGILVILVFGAACQLLHLDYGFIGMACIGAMYLFRATYNGAAFWGCICLNLEFFTMPGAFLSLLPLSLYDGTRGKQMKYFFYLFYPLHLLLLFLLKCALMHG